MKLSRNICALHSSSTTGELALEVVLHDSVSEGMRSYLPSFLHPFSSIPPLSLPIADLSSGSQVGMYDLKPEISSRPSPTATTVSSRAKSTTSLLPEAVWEDDEEAVSAKRN